jgi:hypothetical protein
MVVDRFEVVLERLAANRDPFLDDECRLGGAKRVSLDRIRRVSQLEIVNVLVVAEAGADHGTQPVERHFLRGDPRHEVVHTLFLLQTEHSWRNGRIEPEIFTSNQRLASALLEQAFGVNRA